MMAHKKISCFLILALGIFGDAFCLTASTLPAEKLEFFENRIRPILAQDCYECHQTNGVSKGGLILDHREALLKGGNSGPAIIPGNPDSSLLIQAIRHSSSDLEMPKSGAPLELEVIHDFEKWIKDGAVDPRNQPPTDEEFTKDTDWEAVMARRKNWWSFQPITQPDIPNRGFSANPTHPVDALIQAELIKKGLTPESRTDKETLLRRLSFTLLGLPPSTTELESFLADDKEDAFDRKVDDYLDSPHFGERWARHWMDWIRYAESHGSEGDPTIPNAWYYRDYLIRALNQDVPYDQLLLEHLAGDLLPSPRINQELGLNESAIGTSQLRMVFHGFAPTDALEEQVRFTDDQINVITKAFQGITVSCARCHDHKFDPISQKDFYAMYGIMASGRPAMIQASIPAQNEPEIRSKMQQLKQKIKSSLINVWHSESADLNNLLSDPSEALISKIHSSKKGDFLWPLAQFSNPEKNTEWEDYLIQYKAKRNTQKNAPTPVIEWDFSNQQSVKDWFPKGPGISKQSPSGSWTLSTKEDSIVQDIFPSGFYSHIDSTKDRGLLHSPRIDLDESYDLWLLINGDGNAMARYAVQNYPRNGTVYPVETMNNPRWRWKKFPLNYWQGDSIHIELTTAADQPVLARLNDTRSWFGIRKAALTTSGAQSPATPSEHLLEPLLDALNHSTSENDLIIAYQTALQQAITAWHQNTITDSQSLFLHEAVQKGLLTNKPVETEPKLKTLLDQWRHLEEQLRAPLRVPGQFETDGYDQVLFDRGNHKKPTQPVPRRFLEFLDDTPYESTDSGRLELARDMLRDDNPLTSRVIVNRIWHHLFGKGIVTTPNNFGRLGQKPTHPELLDHLAYQFKENDWSIKKLIRYLVTSDTWQRSSEVSDLSATKDPENKLWSHYPIKRLEAESIRDNLLSVSGKLDKTTMFGAPINGTSNRRSVYVRVKRNNLDPFLTLFDAPVPASSRGRRDATNVPGQSLSMLNDPFIIDCSEAFADSLQNGPQSKELSKRQKIQHMFVKALGRLPTLTETVQSEHFLDQMNQLASTQQSTIRSLTKKSENLKNQLEYLNTQGRSRVLAKRKPSHLVKTPAGPTPLASWDFSMGPDDQVGNLDLTMKGEAQVKDGLLILNGKNSFVKSPALQQNIEEKTLEAWVRLNNLQQRGGGVMSIQNNSGNVFDAIVFAEQESQKWLAGSDGFSRTQSLNGPTENVAHEEFVHIAVTYHQDGTIKCFRNGKPYGKAYKSSGPVKFENENAHLIFGNRHGAPSGNRLLKGAIAKARFYAWALSEDEIEASYNNDPNYVSVKDLLAELTPDEKKSRQSIIAEIKSTQGQLAESKNKRGLSSPWADLAHAIFNLKEFIYVQ